MKNVLNHIVWKLRLTTLLFTVIIKYTRLILIMLIEIIILLSITLINLGFKSALAVSSSKCPCYIKSPKSAGTQDTAIGICVLIL